MNSSITYSQAPSTMGQVLIAAGFIATQLATTLPPPSAQEQQAAKPLLLRAYYSGLGDSTFNSNRSPFSGMYAAADEPFEITLGNAYSRLLAHQEPLGPEFEKVLYENRWELYES